MNALILVDLQNDFLPGGSLAVPHGNEVIPIANQLQPYFNLVVATQDWHPADHLSFASQHAKRHVGEIIDLDGLPQVLWPDHCVQHSVGAELAKLLNTNSISRVFSKGTDLDSYSGFFDNGGQQETGLGIYLRERKVTDNFILGLATDYCVRATAIDSCRLGFRTWLIEDACRGVELRPGDCAAAMIEMEQAGVQRVTSDRWVAEHRDRVNYAARTEITTGRFISLMQSGHWEYAQRNNASAVVVIVAITVADEFVFVEQYREPLGKRCIELPAGLVGDSPGDENEDLAEAVQRELREETGFQADRVTFLGAASASAGLTNETSSLYLAEGLRRVADGGGVDGGGVDGGGVDGGGVDGGGVDGELIQVHLVPRHHVAEWLASRSADGLNIAMSLYAGMWVARQALRTRL